MKKIFIALLSVACVFSACSDDDTTDTVSNATISISTEEVSAGVDGGTAEVTVTSSGDWRLAGVCDWAHASADSGKSGDVVTFTIEPNTEEDSREATFKFFTGSAVVPLKVVSAPGYALELVSEPEIKLDALSADIRIKVHSNITDLKPAFSDGGETWIKFNECTEAFGNKVFNFTVAKHEGYDDRHSTITIAGGEQKVEVKLTQERVFTINVAKDSFEFDLSAQNFTVAVDANVEYTVTTPQWIKQQPATRGLVSKTLTFTAEAAKATRSGSITIEGSGLTKVISVLQKDPNAVVVTIPDEVFIGWLSSRGWITQVGPDKAIVSETGLNATELIYNVGWGQPQCKTVVGIENFPNLKKVVLTRHMLEELDLSKLTKVSELACDSNAKLQKINLGDNPITSLSPFDGGFSDAPELTVISSKLESLDLHIDWGSFYDKITMIDVSGCPALQTLNCDRSDKVKTLRLKKGQVIPNLTKNDATQIVYVD